MSTRSRAAQYARIRCTYTEWSFRTTLPTAPARLILAVHLATGQRLTARDETQLEEKLMSAQRAMRNNWGNRTPR